MAATASGRGQVRGEIALRDTTQWRGTWMAIPADLGTEAGFRLVGEVGVVPVVGTLVAGADLLEAWVDCLPPHPDANAAAASASAAALASGEYAI